MSNANLISFGGLFVLMGFGWLLSANRRNVNWRAIGWGVGIQLVIALFVFAVPLPEPIVCVFLAGLAITALGGVLSAFGLRLDRWVVVLGLAIELAAAVLVSYTLDGGAGWLFARLFALCVLAGLAWLGAGLWRGSRPRAVVVALAAQIVFGLLIWAVPHAARTLEQTTARALTWSRSAPQVFLWLNDRVVAGLDAAMAGQRFLFGPLADPGKTGGFVLATQALPVIIFFAALMALLYHWRVMPLVIRGFAWVFTRLMRISGAESLCVASNIFVGVESATAVRPYLSRMTRSELCTILTAGMATVASSTLGLYVLLLGKVFPTIAGHLISASLLSAPAAIVMSKLLMPEDGVPLTMGRRARLSVESASGGIEAVINGSMAGVKLVVGVCALLIAFLGLIAVANLFIKWSVLATFPAPPGPEVAAALETPIERLLGVVMAPFALVMGVPLDDALVAGRLLGQRLIATEVPAYIQLGGLMEAKAFASPRTPVVMAYALCGFAHVASLAIFVGGIAALVPERRRDLAEVGPRALLAATLACLMTGAVAGTFYQAGVTVLQAAPK